MDVRKDWSRQWWILCGPILLLSIFRMFSDDIAACPLISSAVVISLCRLICPFPNYGHFLDSERPYVSFLHSSDPLLVAVLFFLFFRTSGRPPFMLLDLPGTRTGLSGSRDLSLGLGRLSLSKTQGKASSVPSSRCLPIKRVYGWLTMLSRS